MVAIERVVTRFSKCWMLVLAGDINQKAIKIRFHISKKCDFVKWTFQILFSSKLLSKVENRGLLLQLRQLLGNKSKWNEPFNELLFSKTCSEDSTSFKTTFFKSRSIIFSELCDIKWSGKASKGLRGASCILEGAGAGGESANKGLAAAFCCPCVPSKTGFMGGQEGKSRRGFAGGFEEAPPQLCARHTVHDRPAPGQPLLAWSERCTVPEHPEQSKQCAEQPLGCSSSSLVWSGLHNWSQMALLASVHHLWLLSKASQVEKLPEVEVLQCLDTRPKFLATSIWELRRSNALQ